MYSVTVVFDLVSEAVDRFLERVRLQGRESLQREPGCSVFDVWTDTERRDRVFLYEVYKDRAAFDVHLRSTHFAAFDRDVRNWVKAKHMVTWDLLL